MPQQFQYTELVGPVRVPSAFGGVPSMAWLPDYPDFARGHRPRTAVGLISEVPPAVPFSWFQSMLYPAFVRGRTPLVPVGYFAFIRIVPLFPPVPVFPHPIYPDFVRRAAPREPGYYVEPLRILTLPLTTIGWLPTYVDRHFTASYRRVPTGIFTEPPHAPTLPIPRITTWLPTYPSRHRYPALKLNPDVAYDAGGVVPSIISAVPGGHVIEIGHDRSWQHHHYRPAPRRPR